MLNIIPDFGFAVGLVLSLVELAKVTFPDIDKNYKRFVPILAVSIGFVMGYLFKFDWLTCLLVGLTASGLYSGVKTAIQNK